MPLRLAGLALLCLLSGCATDEPTACDGFADRKLGIKVAEYRDCAGEILAALDAIEPRLQAIVAERGTDDDRREARQAYKKLAILIRKTGIESDYRSRPEALTMKWPEGPISAFNSGAVHASVQYMAVLNYPNADNFGQGVRAHEQARRCYREMR